MARKASWSPQVHERLDRKDLSTFSSMPNCGLSPRQRALLVVVLVLVLHVALLSWKAWHDSPTICETAHLPAGLHHWRTGRYDLYRVNPPLVRMIAAIPVSLADPATDWSRYDRHPFMRSERVVGWDFLKANGSRSLFLFALARTACVPFSVLGGAVCFAWARGLYGWVSGLVALCLWCFSPYLLGHACLITPDAHASAMGLAACFTFWHWLNYPTIGRAFCAGSVLGLAELTKFTLLPFLPLWPLMWIVHRWSNRHSAPDRNWRQESAMLALILLLSVLVVNLAYGFEGSFQRLGQYHFQTAFLTGTESRQALSLGGGNRFAGSPLGLLPLPFPSNFVQGIDSQKLDFDRKMDSYLHGEWKTGGWWYFYIYAMAVKLPLGTWCLVLSALAVTCFGHGYNAAWRDEMIVLAPALLLLVCVSSQTGFSIHSRYLMPVMPFVFIWTSKIARVFQMRQCTPRRRALATVTAAALTWSVGSSLWIYPHSLSYFNELAGGPKNGGKHLLSSNIDWGQDLLYLKAWLEMHPYVTLDGLAYSGSHPATMAGMPHTPAPPSGTSSDYRSAASGRSANLHGPRPGWYAVSVNCLYDRTCQHRYFLEFEPVGSAGYSIYIYHVTRDQADQARSELRSPGVQTTTSAD